MNFNLALLGKQRRAQTRRAISLSRCPPGPHKDRGEPGEERGLWDRGEGKRDALLEDIEVMYTIAGEGGGRRSTGEGERERERGR